MLTRALSECGHVRMNGQVMSPRVKAYLQAAGIVMPESAPPPYMSGALLAFCAIREGLSPPPNPLNASSWADWGHPLEYPEAGAIVTLTAEGSSLHKCGVVTRITGQRVFVVGFEDQIVSILPFPLANVISCRRQPNGAMPLPVMGPDREVRVVIEQAAVPLPQGVASVTPASAPMMAAPSAMPQPDAVPPSAYHAPVSSAQMPVPQAPAFRTPQQDPIIPKRAMAEVAEPIEVVAEDLNALRESTVLAMAAVADAHSTYMPDLARLAAEATSAVTREGILAARDRAFALINGG